MYIVHNKAMLNDWKWMHSLSQTYTLIHIDIQRVYKIALYYNNTFVFISQLKQKMETIYLGNRTWHKRWKSIRRNYYWSLSAPCDYSCLILLVSFFFSQQRTNEKISNSVKCNVRMDDGVLNLRMRLVLSNTKHAIRNTNFELEGKWDILFVLQETDKGVLSLKCCPYRCNSVFH